MRKATSAVFMCVFAASLSGHTPSFTLAGVVNAASFAAGPIAPRELTAILGAGLGPSSGATCSQLVPLAATCGFSSVLVNGKAAPIELASKSEIVFETPVGLLGSSATLQVTTRVNAQTLQSAIVTVPVAAAAPGIFTAADNIGGFTRVAGNSFISASNAALPGDVLTVYGAGFGQTNPRGVSGIVAPANAQVVAPVTVAVAGLSAKVLAAGPSSTALGSIR